jgi:phenylpropionate dioxygenase-like ring-hydroxylating dioxygenase large terminal subunit
MIEETHWHPVALCDEVARQPLAVTLLDRALVLWRDAGGVVHVWVDQCPHRGARLSLGRVIDGRLECPYHGWQFGPSGRCLHVPALPAFEPPATHCARSFQCREVYGLVWVKLASSAAAESAQALVDIPLFEAEQDDQLRRLNCGPYDVATSAPRIVENFLDMAHFGFVHEGWLGMRAMTAIDDYLVEPTQHGLLATNCRAWQPQSNVHSSAPALVEYRYEVTAPYCAVLTKVPDPASLASSLKGSPYRESIALFICPLGPQTSRVWFRLAVADFASTDDKLREFQHTIFMQDKPILESQSPKCLPLDVRDELHTAADKASSAYRRHLKKLGITFGVC